MIKLNFFGFFFIAIIGSTDVAASSFGDFLFEPPGPGTDGPSCTYKGETYPNGARVYMGGCSKYYCNNGEIELYWFEDCGLHHLMGQGINVSKCTKTYREGRCCPTYDCPPEAYPGTEGPEEYSSSSSPSEEYSSEAPEEYSSSPPTPDSASKTLKCVTVQ